MLQHAQIPNFTAVGIMPSSTLSTTLSYPPPQGESGTEPLEDRTFFDRLTLKF